MRELLPGTQVRARGLPWEVVTSHSAGEHRQYRLRSLHAGLRGAELDLLVPFETVEPLHRDLDPTRAAPLRPWLVYHQAFLLEQSFGPDALLSAQPGRLKLEPYQLVPVLRALRMGRVRLLLADGVGLGKTIQAGLIICELMARRLAHRVLIVSPAGPLLEQWRLEFRDRFGLQLDVIDRARLERVRRETELGAIPFDHIPLGVASIDFLKQEKVLEQLERSAYDIVVIDEAHHCFDLGAASERDDSQRRRLAEVLARRTDSLILATATPHDGNDRSLASLCELLDPSLVDGRGSLRGERYRNFVVRRLKHHVRDPKTKKPLFPDREVQPVPVAVSPKKNPRFTALHRGVLELVKPILARALQKRSYGDALAFIALLKRSVSTVAACHSTLQAVKRRFDKLVTSAEEDKKARDQRIRALRDMHRKLARFGTVSHDEESEREALESEDIASQLAALHREAKQGARQVKHAASIANDLETLIGLASEALSDDPKLAQLVEAVREIRKAEPHANILIYSEYTDSQAAALKALAAAKPGEILKLSGEDDDQKRLEITERFRLEDGLILVSTDASAEGLNLHLRCHHLLHLELPFNPNRLEQRNGRIDRFGQRETPRVRYLFLQGTFEAQILLKLIVKYERQRARLTFVPNTLGISAAQDAVAEGLVKGLLVEEKNASRADSNETTGLLFKLDQPEPEDKDEDPAVRELLAEIDRSLRGFEQAAKTYSWLGDAGLYAEADIAIEAEGARGQGETATGVALSTFVRAAALREGGGVESECEGVLRLKLPQEWCHGFDDLPGFEPSTGLMRLTLEVERTRDAEGKPVGFLGRAHPIVRRALERMRRLEHGSDAKMQDVRVSAVRAAVERPELLATFLGRVPAASGAALERVIGVRFGEKKRPNVFLTPSDWLWIADPERACSANDLWDTHFSSWGTGGQKLAAEVATEAFAPLARRFADETRTRLAEERKRLDEWLVQRCRELTGDDVRGAPPKQRDLFAAPDPQQALFAGRKEEPPKGAWEALVAGEERLASFGADRTVPGARRSEADGVLRLYRKRVADLKAQRQLGDPELVPIGLLMIVSEDAAASPSKGRR